MEPERHRVDPLLVPRQLEDRLLRRFLRDVEKDIAAHPRPLDLFYVNAADDQGRTALHGAANKGRTDVIQLLVDHGANLEAHDLGSRDTVNGAMKGMTWIPLDWARGLVRVGVQSAIAHPEAEKLLVKLMTDRGMKIPPPPKSSICLTKGVNGCE